MANTFFTSWQLWEKLCFILACGIFLVVFLGCLKLIYNHWRLRRYTKIDQSKAAMKQEMHHSQSVDRRRRIPPVPFGVRAIESGIEVDGVWISRSNTPASSQPASPALSATSFRLKAPHSDSTPGRESTSSDITRIEISQPLQEDPGPSSSSKLQSPFDRPVRKHEPPPASDHQLRGRPTYQPRRSSGLRYSDSFDPDDDESLTTLGNNSIQTKKDGKRPEGSGSDFDDGRPTTSWSASSSNSEVGKSQDKRMLKPPSNAFLTARSHIIPKNRKPAFYELTDPGLRGYSQAPHIEVRDNSFVPGPEGVADSFNPMHDDGVSDGRYHPSAPGNNPFTAPFGNPNSEGAERATWFSMDHDIADQHSRLMEDSNNGYSQNLTQPPQPFDGNRQLRRSQVIRKINSGFEILRPGTLNAPGESNKMPELIRDHGETSKRESKKLQKRGRASSRSSYTLER